MIIMEQLLKTLGDAKGEAKKYIHENEIPQLFECILAGLLHHRPDDPVHFVQSCVDAAKGRQLFWDMFIEWIPPLAKDERENKETFYFDEESAISSSLQL